MLYHFPNHEKTDPSEENQSAGGQVQHDAILIRYQVLKISQYIKAGIVERRHRMEQADSHRPKRRIILYKDKKAQDRPGQLKNQRRPQHAAYKPDGATVGIQIGGLLDQAPAFQVELFPHGQHNSRADGRDAQPADLYQQRKNHLSEGREGVSRVHGDQPGHADGARGCIERIDVFQLCAIPHAARQHHQRGAQKNRGGKAQRNQSRRRLHPKEPFHSALSPFMR